MTAREQLAEQVARIQANWGRMPPIVGVARFERITLEVRADTLRMSVMSGVWSRVNASETCGAPAGHLWVLGSWSRVEDTGGSPAYWLTIRLVCRDAPWKSATGVVQETADFDALLAALEAGASPPQSPPERAETWRDRPGLL